MKIHQLSAADAIASLKSNPQGLSSAEAQRRLAEYGFNRVEEVARESMLLRFLKEFTHFFALILWLAAGLAFLAEWSDPGQGMAKIGYAILAVILVSGAVLLLAGISGRTNAGGVARAAAATGRGVARR